MILKIRKIKKLIIYIISMIFETSKIFIQLYRTVLKI